MQLPNVIKNFIDKKKEEVDYYLALQIKKGSIGVAIWNEVNKKSLLVGTAGKNTTDDWKDITEKIDEAISEAAGTIDQEKINKTIFGLPEYWIEEGKIKKEILVYLKKLCSDLTLSPLGFVVNTESILSFVQKTEEAPLSAILVDIAPKEVFLSVVRVGKISAVKIWERKDQELSKEIAESLKELPDKEILPSRIILYDGHEDLETIRQELISYPWTQKNSFLHFPKVEILPQNADLEGLIYLGTKEVSIQFPQEEVPDASPATISNSEPTPTTIAGPIINHSLREDVGTIGFVEDMDIDIKPREEIGQENKDIVIEPRNSPEPANNPVKRPPISLTVPKINLPKPNLNFSYLSSFSLGKSAILTGIIIVIVIAGSLWGYYQFSKASITIFVQPQSLEKEAEIVVNPNIKSPNKDNNEIPAVKIEIEEKDLLKKATTGEKTVGEKAKGEITIYNKTTTGSKTFKAGTILTSGEKSFTTDDDATIAAATEETEGISFGKTKVKVTAIEIGDKFNLPAGKKEFIVKEYPATSYSGISDSAFTGGSSKKVKIISEDDIKNLAANLTKKLSDKAKVDLAKQLSSGQKLIDESIEKISDKPKYSGEAGSESNELTLENSIKFKAFIYNENDIQEIVNSIVKKSVPSDFEYNSNKTEMQVKSKEDLTDGTKDQKGAVLLKVVFKTKLLPKIDNSEVIKTISGKNEETAKNYIETLPNVVGFEATIWPKLPKPFFLFPRNQKNITVEVIPKG